MSDDNTFENDSDKSNVVPLFGSDPWWPKNNMTSIKTPGLQEFFDAIRNKQILESGEDNNDE